MKYTIWIMITTGCMLWGQEGIGQNNQQLKKYIEQLLPSQTPQQTRKDRIYKEIKKYLGTLSRKQTRSKNDRRFLKFLFYNVQKKYLKRFQMHRNFADIFSDSKQFNCVSAATLYALLLQELGYKYTIHETPFHVFLVVHTQKDPQIMFDPTDARQGFLYNPYAIRKRIRYHSEKDGHKLNLPITLPQLIGLQYYNQGVDDFNHQKFDKALAKLSRAYEFYPSERIEALRTLTSHYYKTELAEK